MARPSGALLLGLWLLASCVPDGLAFIQDERVEIVEPESHTTVTLPVTIRWTLDAQATPGAGPASFGVFLDRAPVPPGRSLAWIARDDQRCLATDGCPDRTYFADRGVYETTNTSLTLEQLRDLDAFRGRETHEATIILLDARGRRIGESAWHTTFFFERDEI